MSWTTALQVGAIALFLLLGAALPRRRQPLLGGHTLTNLATGAALFGLRLAVVAPVAAHAEVGWLDGAALRWPGVQFLAAFLLLDLSRYLLHRAHHRVPFLWTFHRVHHSSSRLDATAGLRMHVVDFVQLAALPVLLFAVLVDTSGWSPWVVPAALSVGAVSDAFQHANLRWPARGAFGRVGGLLLNNPHFHAWHHNDIGPEADGNYGNVLVIWDRLFRSEVTRPELPERFGLPAEGRLLERPLALQLLRRAA